MRERDVFIEAVQKGTPAEIDAYLDATCGGDDELRRRVDALLTEHRRQGSFILDSASPGLGATIDQPVTEHPGTLIGPYKLLEQIGEGGMGVVFLAEQQQPVRRQVALKVIKAGMDTRRVVSRFDAERQALALMDHPNIAKVLDAGATGGGRPYFVMELVHGVPITQYCDDNRLTPRQRLELFVPVCQAIQHAHQKGIIHRDIKPTNVMVTLYDGKPVPKVIDFGVAKATEQRLTERTLFTQFGTMVGTPQYMSPEQAEMSALGADTRSDIFSLGVLLYELLTGSTPLSQERLREAAYGEVLRMIREEEAPRPSTRLSDSGEALASISAQRHMEPARLMKLVRGELDWIVMKTLEKDRSRRYETATGLAMDVQRYLCDEAVHAAKPSARYRLRKFVRRNKGPVAASAAVVLVLVIGFFLTTVGFVQAKRQRASAQRNEVKARTEAAKATAVSGFLQKMLESANPEQAQADYSLRQLLDDFSAVLGDQLAAQPEVEAEVRLTIGRAYRRLGVTDRAESNLQMAVDLSRRAYGPEHEKVAECLIDYGWNLANQKRGVEAEKATREALRIYRLRDIRGKAYIKGLWILQTALLSAGHNAESEVVTQEALAIADASPGVEFPELANMLHRHAGVLFGRKEYAAAEEWGRRSVEMHRRLQGDGHPETAWGLRTFARALQAQRRVPEAESALREAVDIFRQRMGDKHEATTAALTQLKQFLKAEGKTSELEALTLELLESARKTENRKESEDWFKRGEARVARRQWDAAVVAYEEAVELTGGIGAQTGTGRQLMAAAQAAAEGGRPDAAVKVYALASRFWDKAAAAAQPSDVPEYRFSQAGSEFQSGFLLANSGRAAEAEKAYRKSIALLQSLAEEFPKVLKYRMLRGRSQNWLGYLLNSNGRRDEAEQQHREAIQTYVGLVELADPVSGRWHRRELAWSRLNLGQLLMSTNRMPEAEPEYQSALAIIGPLAAEYPADPQYQVWIRDSRTQLGRLYAATNRPDDAKKFFIKVIELDAKSVDAWTARGDYYMATGEFAKAAEDFSTAIKLKPDHSESWTRLGNALWGKKEFDEAVAYYHKAIDLNPADAGSSLKHLGDAYAQLGMRDKAAAEYRRSLELSPDHMNYFYAAALFLYENDLENYRRACVALVAHFGKTDNIHSADITIKVCALAPGFGADANQVMNLADAARFKEQAGGAREWFELSRAMAHYRANRFESAAEIIAGSVPLHDIHRDASALSILAMAQHRRGNGNEARTALSSAQRIISTKMPKVEKGELFGNDWHDWLHAQILCREAEQVLSASPATTQTSQ